MNIIGIIPSRYASTRLPAKSLADIHGKPMVQHVYERACESSLITRVIVATDDERIRAAVERFGGEAVMTSPAIQSGSDRIAAAAREVKDADIIVNIQGDEPLIAPAMIDETIRLLLDDPAAEAGTAVKVIRDAGEVTNPNIVKVVLDTAGYALYFSRSPIPHVRDQADLSAWLKETTFYKHFGLYVYRSDFLQRFTSWSPSALERAEKLEQLRILENGHRIKCAVTKAKSIAVDTQEDLDKVRAAFANRA